MRCWSFTSCASGIDARCIDRSANIGEISSEVRPRGGRAVDPPRLISRRRVWTSGVQECGFVRGSHGARNLRVAPCQFRPATTQNRQIGLDLPVLLFRSYDLKDTESG
jgi:hypothetical protein